MPASDLGPEVDRFAGCLVGQALGDALGFIVEGYPPGVCATYVGHALRPRRLFGQVRGPFAIGQYSDDTQLARELARSLVERRQLDPADYALRIAALFTEGRIVGRGRATEDAACRIAGGVPWHAAGTPAPAAGNGSAMRTAPIGPFFWDDLEALIAAAHDQGRITHQDLRCSAGAVAIACATAIAVTVAVAGGFAGVRHGLSGIPERWLSALAGRELAEPLVARLLGRWGDIGGSRRR